MRFAFLPLVHALLCLTSMVMSRPNPNDVKTVAMNRPDPNDQSSNLVLTSLVISKPNSHDLTNPEPGIKSSKPGIMYKKLLGKIFGGYSGGYNRQYGGWPGYGGHFGGYPGVGGYDGYLGW